MDGDCIVTACLVVDKLMATLGHRDHVVARASDAAVLTVAVVAAKYFQHHLARTLQLNHLGRYLSGPLSVSRFNRRLHRLADWLQWLGPPVDRAGHSQRRVHQPAHRAGTDAVRRARGATVPAADLQATLTEVHRDWQREYRVVEIAVDLVDRAMALAEQDGRRGYEAMHLAAALAVNQALMTQGQRALVFVSADRDR